MRLQSGFVGFLADDDDPGQPAREPRLRLAHQDAGEAEYTETQQNPMAEAPSTVHGAVQRADDLFIETSAATTGDATTSGSSLATLAMKTGVTEGSIASMGDEELFELMMEAGIGVLLRNRVISEVEASRVAKEKREKKTNGAAAPAHEQGEQLEEVRRQLQELRPAHEARVRWLATLTPAMMGQQLIECPARGCKQNKLWLNVLLWLGAVSLWTWLYAMHFGGLYFMLLNSASTDQALVQYARNHQTVAAAQSFELHGPFGTSGSSDRRLRRRLMKAAPPPPPGTTADPEFALSKAWAIPAPHTALQVDFRIWALGSWDAETIEVLIDGNEVFRVKDITMYVWIAK